MPGLYIITGSNGAGKSSTGADYLPVVIKENNSVFDGDKLFVEKQRELWRNGIRAHKEAKKIAYEFVTDTFDSLVASALLNNTDFVYEGHFTNEATWDIPRNFKSKGYHINLIFLGLANTELSALRVAGRVNEGGHYVDPITIADNYYGNMSKLNEHFQMFDSLLIIDASEVNHLTIATYTNGVLESSIPYDDLPAWFISYLPNLALQIKQR